MAWDLWDLVPGASTNKNAPPGPKVGYSVFGDARRIPAVEHQRVAVGVGEERHVADARVERLAHELHAAGGELLACDRDVVDVQRDGVGIAVVLHAHLLRVVDAE